MGVGIKRSGVVGMLCFAILASAAFLFVAVGHGAEKPSTTPVAEAPADKTSTDGRAAEPARADLIVRDRYEVNVKCGDVVRSYEGMLVKANDRWILLRQDTICGSGRLVLLGNVPIIGLWVCRACELPCAVNQWIPREGVTIVSRRRVPEMPYIEDDRKDEPEDSGSCTCLARNGKVVEGEASLPATADDKLRVSINDAAGSRQELVARRNIFCISQYERPGVDFSESAGEP